MTYANNYNTYVKTGDLSGTQASAYLSLVPFQTGNSTDLTTLSNIVGSNGWAGRRRHGQLPLLPQGARLRMG